MAVLKKDGGTKTVSNEELIKKLLADGWTSEETEKKEIKDDKASKSKGK